MVYPGAMEQIRNAVLATIVYYDAFDFPLTLQEIYAYLVNPGRFVKKTRGLRDIKLSAIASCLKMLEKQEKIGEKNGFYYLWPERSDLCELRIEREKLSAQKWKKLLQLARWFQFIPYLRAVFVSGSMALSQADPESDFDMLIVTRGGRLYTCRFLLSALASFLGARRKWYERHAPDKFCFNHYLADDALAITHVSLYTAQMYATLKPIFVRGDIRERFILENSWLNRYVYNFRDNNNAIGREVRLWRIASIKRTTLEAILNTFLGTALEHLLRWYQQRRIMRNPVTYLPDGRTVFTDHELEFHPHSAEKDILAKYNKTVARLGFWNYMELDSGLRSV